MNIPQSVASSLQRLSGMMLARLVNAASLSPNHITTSWRQNQQLLMPIQLHPLPYPQTRLYHPQWSSILVSSTPICCGRISPVPSSPACYSRSPQDQVSHLHLRTRYTRKPLIKRLYATPEALRTSYLETTRFTSSQAIPSRSIPRSQKQISRRTSCSSSTLCILIASFTPREASMMSWLIGFGLILVWSLWS